MRFARSVSDESLAALRGVPAARARLDEDELDLVDRARRDGATWADIASALGLASRQAAEQRRSRLATAVADRRRREVAGQDPPPIAALRAAAAELDRRLGADRRWDARFPRAALVRHTVAAAPTAVPGGLFSLVRDVLPDLAAAPPRPGPTRVAVDRLRAAFEAAIPKG
jgi:hypothetical protein